MGKTSICIKMLELLNTGRIFKVSELAYILETTSRNIIEYKRELEEAGYYIDSIPGRYGGYKLEKSNIMPSLKLTNEEKLGLMKGYEMIMSKPEFMYTKHFVGAMSKISSSILLKHSEEPTIFIDKWPLAMPKEQVLERYDLITEAIKKKKTLKLEYLTTKNVYANKEINPYKLYMFDNEWYVLALSKNDNDIKYFKLNRIGQIELTNEDFRVGKYFNASDYLDEYGMKRNGEWYDVELKLSGKSAILPREYVYGRNQEIKVDGDSTILSCKMQYKDKIIKFVLGFGSDCEIIKPEWLKEEILIILEKMMKSIKK